MTRKPYKTASFVLESNVAADGTFEVAYPTGSDRGDFENAQGHVVVLNGDELRHGEDIQISFGATTATITNKTGAALIAGKGYATFYMQGVNSRELVAEVDTMDPATGISAGVRKTVNIHAQEARLMLVQFGAPVAADPDGILDGVTATDSAQVYTQGDMLTYELDVPRNVTIVGSAGSNHVVTIKGLDEYGQPVAENLTANGTTGVAGKKAFKTIRAVEVAAGASGDTLDVGWGDVLGLPFRLDAAAQVVTENEDGAAASSGGTFVAGLAPNTISTATTADVRGTYDPDSACDGAKSFDLLIRTMNPTDIGQAQYAV